MYYFHFLKITKFSQKQGTLYLKSVPIFLLINYKNFLKIFSIFGSINSSDTLKQFSEFFYNSPGIFRKIFEN